MTTYITYVIVIDFEYKELDPDGYFTNEEKIAKDVVFRPVNNDHYGDRLIQWCKT